MNELFCSRHRIYSHPAGSAGRRAGWCRTPDTYSLHVLHCPYCSGCKPKSMPKISQKKKEKKMTTWFDQIIKCYVWKDFMSLTDLWHEARVILQQQLEKCRLCKLLESSFAQECRVMRGIQDVGIFAFFPIRKRWFLKRHNWNVNGFNNRILLHRQFTHLNLQFPQTKYLHRCRDSQPAHCPWSVWQTLSGVLAIITVSALKTWQSALFSWPSTTNNLSKSQRASRSTSSTTLKRFLTISSKVLKSKLPPCWQTSWKIYDNTACDIVRGWNSSMCLFLTYTTAQRPSTITQTGAAFNIRVARFQSTFYSGINENILWLILDLKLPISLATITKLELMYK